MDIEFLFNLMIDHICKTPATIVNFKQEEIKKKTIIN